MPVVAFLVLLILAYIVSFKESIDSEALIKTFVLVVIVSILIYWDDIFFYLTYGI